MVFLLTFMTIILAIIYYTFVSAINFDNLLIELLISLFIFGMGMGTMIMKYARYKYEHMSKWRYVGGGIVLLILILAATEFGDLINQQKKFSELLFIIWISILGLFILSLPVIDITRSEDEESPSI